MIKTTGLKDVHFFSEPDGVRRRMLPSEYGRNSGRRWFSRVGAYPGHVQAADGWFVRGASNRSDWFISSGANVPSNRLNNSSGYTRNPSKDCFERLFFPKFE